MGALIFLALALVVSAARGVVPPTALPKVVLPVLLAVSEKPPFTVLTKVILAAPAARVVFAPSVTASL